MIDDFARANQRAWDLKTPHHVKSSFYDVPFFLSGGSTLKRLERDLCGCVRGLNLLHLQCHFGLDTLSWARLGAHVTGVDFSAAAIAAARSLADQCGLDATFIEADVQVLPDSLDSQFDLVISTYGTLCWLSDLKAWAHGVANALRPGGRFLLVEFHPILDVLHGGCISSSDDYFGNEVRELKSRGTYAEGAADVLLTEYLWQHPVSEVVAALIGEGMRLNSLIEYPFCSYRVVPDLDVKLDGYWHSSKYPRRIPYLYSILLSR